jgi:hypothetical protein
MNKILRLCGTGRFCSCTRPDRSVKLLSFSVVLVSGKAVQRVGRLFPEIGSTNSARCVTAKVFRNRHDERAATAKSKTKRVFVLVFNDRCLLMKF